MKTAEAFQSMTDPHERFPWGESREIQTRLGPRLIRTCVATSELIEVYSRRRRGELADVTLGEYRGKKIFTLWKKLDATEQGRRQKSIEASRAANTEIEIPCPKGREYLDFQIAGIAYALQTLCAGRGCLIADEQGLGKTVQAIGVINVIEDIRKVLIVCPNTLKINWRNELGLWLTKPLQVAVQTAGHPYAGDDAEVLIINYDIVARFPLAKTKWDLRILDESHAIKNPKAKRTKEVLKIGSRYKLALTGTPILNRPVEIFTVLNDLDKKAWPNFFEFGKRYCGARFNGFGWDFNGASNSSELQDRLRSTIMVRRLKQDVLTELPPKRRQIIELPANGSARMIARENAEWEAREVEFETLRERVRTAKVSADQSEYSAAVRALRDCQGAAFGAMAEIRKEIGIAKLPYVIEFIRDSLENGKVIVFGHHLEVVDRLKSEFPQAAVVTGETAAEKRQAEVERFQSDPACNIFIGNLAAAEGLTLTSASHVIFAEGQWVPGKMAQMEDRAHRIGQTESVLVTYLVFEGSLDAMMAKACAAKLEMIDGALDRDAAVIEN